MKKRVKVETGEKEKYKTLNKRNIRPFKWVYIHGYIDIPLCTICYNEQNVAINRDRAK